ncbi:uncharacterized protein EURHEDRAFT_411761, partial [Aspergillus ruber CBS 135680]
MRPDRIFRSLASLTSVASLLLSRLLAVTAALHSLTGRPTLVHMIYQSDRYDIRWATIFHQIAGQLLPTHVLV